MLTKNQIEEAEATAVELSESPRSASPGAMACLCNKPGEGDGKADSGGDTGTQKAGADDGIRSSVATIPSQPKPAEPVRRWIITDPKLGPSIYELRGGAIWMQSCVTRADLVTMVSTGIAREIGPEVKTPGLRCICQWCSTDLPHSDRKGWRTSHGQCNPPCPQTPEEWRKVIEKL